MIDAIFDSAWNRFPRNGEEVMEEKTEAIAIAETTDAVSETEIVEGEITCRWCKKNQEYEEEIEVGEEEITTRCIRCKLKTWIRGDGWERYEEIHSLSEGCEEPAHETRSSDPLDTSSDGPDSLRAYLNERTGNGDGSGSHTVSMSATATRQHTWQIEDSDLSHFEVSPDEDGLSISSDDSS